MSGSSYDEPLYLYLEKPEWADPWVNGGRVPLYPCSKYKSKERAATQTPDELIIRDSYGVQAENMDLFRLLFGDSGGPMNVFMSDGTFTDASGRTRSIPFASITTAASDADAIVLCLSRARSKAVRDRLRKTTALKIVNLPALCEAFSKHFNLQARPRNVLYTEGYDRGPHLKSMADSWQHEARFIFPVKDLVETWVELPSGIAEVIDLDIASMYEPDGRGFDHGGYDRAKVAQERRSMAETFGQRTAVNSERPPLRIVSPEPSPHPQSRTPIVDEWLRKQTDE